MDNATDRAAKSGPILPPAGGVASPAVPTRGVWRNWLYRFITAVYFERVAVVYPERLPRTGPVLYLGLHRNGAVDGFVYDGALGNPVFMISTQLRKNWFARLFFDGIAVTRTKDEGDHAANDTALRQCLDHLRSGGDLFVFPEGTSSLGPRHLPFKSGAVWLLLDYLEKGDGPPLQVVPVGIHYECPWEFRSKVEVVVGQRISTDLAADASRIERLKMMKRRMTAALEDVGINVPSEEHQELIYRLAYVATVGTGKFYFKSLKMLEQAVPEKITEEWRGFEPELQGAKLWSHQGVPFFSARTVVFLLAALLMALPVVFAAIIFNLPGFIAGWYAGRKFPDGRNVISLWKILVGLPVFALWGAAVVVTLLLLGKFLWLAAYMAITCAGLKLYHPCKAFAVALHNALREPALRRRMLEFRQTVLQSLPDESA